MKQEYLYDAEDHITPEAVDSSATSRIPANSVLLVTRSGILRHSLPVAVNRTEVTINQDLKALIPASGINPAFVAHALRAAEQEILHNAAKSGTTVQSIEFAQLLRFQVSIAPQPEQQRVVAEVEQQLTRLDAAKANLQKVTANLRAYRASILKAACEGRLVPTEAELARAEGRSYEPAEQFLARVLEERRRRWKAEYLAELRAQGKEPRDDSWKLKYREPAPPDTKGLPELPEGWCWASWEQIGFSQNGRPFPSSEYCSAGVKLLRPGNLHDSGEVVWNASNTRCLPGIWAEKNPSVIVGPHELVMNLTAQSLKDEFLGRVCMTGASESCLLNQRLARLTPVLAHPRYLLWVFKSPLFRRFVDGLNTGSLIQHIFTSQLARFILPLPPLSEQKRIVGEVERRFSIVTNVAASVESHLRRSIRLRQAVLQHAFEGKLVPQDPDDELASVLLERIRAAREKQARPADRRRRARAADSDDPLSLPSPAPAPKTAPEPPPTSAAPPVLALPETERALLTWVALLGHGALDRDEAVRRAAEAFRDQGLAPFQRLRRGGPLYEAIDKAIAASLRAGTFDRPHRSTVRAVCPDARDYGLTTWRRCLFAVLDGAPSDIDDTFRAAAEWARENIGLQYTRLPREGIIFQSLMAALDDAEWRGEMERVGIKQVRRKE